MALAERPFFLLEKPSSQAVRLVMRGPSTLYVHVLCHSVSLTARFPFPFPLCVIPVFTECGGHSCCPQLLHLISRDMIFHLFLCLDWLEQDLLLQPSCRCHGGYVHLYICLSYELVRDLNSGPRDCEGSTLLTEPDRRVF